MQFMKHANWELICHMEMADKWIKPLEEHRA